MVFEQGIFAHLNEKETLEANARNKYQLVYRVVVVVNPMCTEQWQIKQPL